jgi:hypothetical protein
VAGPVAMVIFFFSLDRPCTASATEDVVSSMMVSTFSVSYHWRAILEATSGLFWWSAVITSMVAPLTVPPKSSTAISAAS